MTPKHDDLVNAMNAHLAAAASELRQFDAAVGEAVDSPFIAAVDARVVEMRSVAAEALRLVTVAQNHLAVFANTGALVAHEIVEEMQA